MVNHRIVMKIYLDKKVEVVYIVQKYPTGRITAQKSANHNT